MKNIGKESRGDAHEKTINLFIANPNPLQGRRGLKRLNNFFAELDISKPMKVTLYFDALAFRTEEGMRRQLDFIQEQLQQHEKLGFHIDLAIDSHQAENDGDFIGRRSGKRLVTQDEYDAILKNHREFIKELSDKPWSNRLSMALNQISHPAMTADIYKQKLGLMCLEGRGFVVQPKEFILLPAEGTRLAERHKGHYAPVDLMEKDWKLGHLFTSDIMSCWGNQFKNGDFLDCIAFTGMASATIKNDYFRVLQALLIDGWDDGKPKYGLIERFSPKNEEKLFSDAQGILDKEPRLIGLMERYMDILHALEKKESKEVAAAVASGFHVSVDWVLRRERYLAKTNPEYANNPNCKKLIKAASAMRIKLLSKPYNYDICPSRNLNLKAELAMPPFPRRVAPGRLRHAVRRPKRHSARNTVTGPFTHPPSR